MFSTRKKLFLDHRNTKNTIVIIHAGLSPPPSTFLRGYNTHGVNFIVSLHFLEKQGNLGQSFIWIWLEMLKELKNCSHILVKTTFVDRFQVKEKCVKINISSINLKLLILSNWFFQEQYWIPWPYDNNNLLPIILLHMLRKMHSHIIGQECRTPLSRKSSLLY